MKAKYIIIWGGKERGYDDDDGVEHMVKSAAPSKNVVMYLQILNIIDRPTSINRAVSGKFTHMVNGCIIFDICIMLDMFPLLMDEHWSSATFSRNLPR